MKHTNLNVYNKILLQDKTSKTKYKASNILEIKYLWHMKKGCFSNIQRKKSIRKTVI